MFKLSSGKYKLSQYYSRVYVAMTEIIIEMYTIPHNLDCHGECGPPGNRDRGTKNPGEIWSPGPNSPLKRLGNLVLSAVGEVGPG